MVRSLVQCRERGVVARSLTGVLALLGVVASSLTVGCAGAGPKNPGSGDGGVADHPREGLRIDGAAYVPAYKCEQKKFPVNYACDGTPGQLGEALQKALWFFHANRCGPQENCGYVQWRGNDHPFDAKVSLADGTDLSAAFIDAHKTILDPDGDGLIDVGGGFHDAGDYIKFGLTQAYSASMLGWSWFEFPEAYKTTGLEGELVYIMKVFADYFAKNTYLDGSGNLLAYAEQVSDQSDHELACGGWMPGEVRKHSMCPRKVYFITADRPAADVTAHGAAALALAYMMIKDTDATAANDYLNKAVALYKFAGQYPSSVSTTPGGLYLSSDAHDDLAWAGLWLYEATKNDQYLKDVMYAQQGSKWTGWLTQMSYLTNYGSCQASNNTGFDTTESWTHCWDSVRAGVYTRLAAIYATRAAGKSAPDPEACLRDGMKKIAFQLSERWTNGTVPQTPAGFAFFVDWGSGRYNSAAQMVALVYNKYFPADGAPFVPWAQSQMDYLLGTNPLSSSYMMGYGSKFESHSHHPNGHAGIYGDPTRPVENRHVIWGALLSGPSDENDGHSQDRADFAANEVAIDYNSSFVAALAGHWSLRGAGQCPLKDWPPTEARIDEFYTRTRVNVAGACSSQVEVTMINESIHPPRYDTHLSARYYYDVKELADKGIDPATVTASIIYDQFASVAPVKLSAPHQCAEGSSTWYVELSYEGQEFWGEIQTLHAPPTTMIRLGVPDTGNCTWDPANDWSYDGLTKESLKTQYVPVYSKGALIFGQAPACGETPLQIIE